MYIDSHAHLLSEEYGDDLRKEIERARKNGIILVNNIGYNLKSSDEAVKLSSEYDFIFASVGIHPYDINEFDESAKSKLALLSENAKTIAIGEIGLDYFRKITDFDKQRKYFAEQLIIAKEKNLPFIIHSREAFEDTWNIIKEIGYFNGVFHSFDYGINEAQKILDKGMYVSFSGMVTFKSRETLRNVLKYVPMDRLLFETDSPYLAPVPVRGKRNNPEFVKFVYALGAKIKNIDIDTLSEIIKNNFIKLFPRSKSFLLTKRRENV